MSDTAPTTACKTCDRAAQECDASHAKGWDGCCMSCDEAGRVNAHRLRIVPLNPEENR